MKTKHTVSLLVALSCLQAGSALAQDDSLLPSFYGRINLTPVINMPDGDGSSTDVVSNASRIGLQGELPVTGSVKFIYQYEYQINPNKEDFNGRVFTQRNSWAGISSPLGTLFAGRNDTPMKLLQGRIDLFNDLLGDIRTLVVSENRPNDTVNYVSPTLAGFTFSYAAIIDGQDSLRDRATKSTSTSLTYTKGSYLVGIAIDNDVNNPNRTSNDAFRFVGQYREGDLQLGILYESSENSANNRGREDGLFVSTALTRGKLVYKAQTGISEARRDGNRQTSLGVDYMVNPDFKWFTFMTATRADNRAQRSDQVGVGMEVRF
jgi:predicted porin